MKAVVCQEGTLDVREVAKPEPGPGHVLIKVLRAGICGSDLHARTHGDVVADIGEQVGYDHFMRPAHAVVMGHEFVGEVVSYGPKCRKRWKPGTPVVAMPLIRHDGEVEMVGLSANAPGAYAEYLLIQEDLAMPVPDGLSADLAALTEPLAVAHHAVRRGEVNKRDVAVVVGCGPIGLAVILMLKAAGVKKMVASDLSEMRRSLALECGADVVVDPAVDSPWDAVPAQDKYFTRAGDLFAVAFDAMHTLQTVPGIPWWRLMGMADKLALTPRGPVVFECVGVPGIIDNLVATAPFRSRVVVVGVCMEPDTFAPAMASNKEIDLRFVFGYDPAEFRNTLHMIAAGKVKPQPLLTGTVGLAGTAAAFDALASAQHHAKVLIDPQSAAVAP
ncbi:zinc-binding dehydrogenase [Gordonia sp. (in: high G+C Gram-positive bacteria)]|uniref:zinc-binding dehydrogenase n=1 Tax=Gordonia sp. (in: high G+C Gram-positive bacteria) TaxID=84139 RepID=UPI0016ADACC1|nr:zinc-binding dehydrogenase [Gordonia sp. (in: high G+C Gram-positive bacteria)]NLG46872.1 zinc-binding dehydrogenase [Gordonia sp. (in: high G+C Gram-positive bacteria)]